MQSIYTFDHEVRWDIGSGCFLVLFFQTCTPVLFPERIDLPRTFQFHFHFRFSLRSREIQNICTLPSPSPSLHILKVVVVTMPIPLQPPPSLYPRPLSLPLIPTLPNSQHESNPAYTFPYPRPRPRLLLLRFPLLIPTAFIPPLSYLLLLLSSDLLPLGLWRYSSVGVG